MISNQSFSNQHSRNSSTSSNYSSLSDFADSLQPQNSNSNLNSFTSNSITFNQNTMEPQSSLNQINSSSSSLPYPSYNTTLSRKSSISGSDTSESHHSVHSNSSYTSGGGGVTKRVLSTRQARSDASPYSRDYQSSSSQAGPSNSEKSVDELAHLFHNRMEYNSSNEGSQYGEDYEEDEEEGEYSGRSSRSSNDDWDVYIPGGGEKLSKQLDGIEGESFSGPHGPQTMMHSGRDPQEVVAVLDQLASDVSSAHSGTARDKARSTFLQSWLGCSYELCEEGNASRQALYGCYAHSCDIYKIKPINSAGFGKAVRQKFVDIKTRRLGQRGASRYHYCGIRPTNAEEASLLVRLTKEEAKDDPAPSLEGTRIKHQRSNSSNILPATPSTARPNLDSSPSQEKKGRGIKSHAGHKSLSISVPPPLSSDPTSRYNESNQDSMNTAVPNPVEAARAFVDLSLTLPGFPSIDELSGGGGGSYGNLDPELARVFWREFSDHCRALMDAVRSFRFDQFELIVRTWWTSMDQTKRILVQNPFISTLIYRSDAAIYDDILEFLNSQLTVPMVPQAFSSLRVLGENMERIQTVALAAFDGIPFTSPKIELAARFGHLITRHLGLCQLVQALTGIVSNPLTMNEMLLAWSTIDLESIKNQSALVSNCDHRLLSECFAGFESLIQNVGSVQNVIQWLQLCFQGCLAQSQGSRQISPRSLLLRWSFVASQIMRDLTLRSAPAFGSYQIFGLFFEELLSMQVLRQVALQITAINPLASGTNVPFPPQHVELQALSPMNSYPVQLNSNSEVPTTNSPYKNNNDLYANESAMDDHLSLLDQFSPKTSEMLRQFSEVNPISPGTFALYNNSNSYSASSPTNHTLSYDNSTSYSALPPTPHGFSSFPNDSLDFNRLPQPFSSLGDRNHYDSF